MSFLILKDHKSAIRVEEGNFDKVVRNSNGTEQLLNFLLFNNCQLEIMRFILSFDNTFLFSNHNMVHMHISKQYNENRGVRAFLTIRKHRINLLPSSNFLPKIVTLLVQYRSLILWGTLNLYCVCGADKNLMHLQQNKQHRQPHRKYVFGAVSNSIDSNMKETLSGK